MARQYYLNEVSSQDSPRVNKMFSFQMGTLTLYFIVQFLTTGLICIHNTMNAFHFFTLQSCTNVHRFE